MSKQIKPGNPELPQIPPKHRARVQQLIKRRCSNFDKGHCLLLDDGWLPCVCPQFSARVLNCRFFRSAVLPDDPELYSSLMRLVPKRLCCKRREILSRLLPEGAASPGGRTDAKPEVPHTQFDLKNPGKTTALRGKSDLGNIFSFPMPDYGFNLRTKTMKGDHYA